MKNKIRCNDCKGTKVYQVSNLEFELCRKCEGKGYIIQTDKYLKDGILENNLDKQQLKYYLDTLNHIGESNLVNLLVPILLKYRKDFYEFYNLSVLDKNFELEIWIGDKVEDTTDRNLLLKFKQAIYNGVRG